jgi:hypothetical protein
MKPILILAALFMLAACSSAPSRDCAQVYALGDGAVATAIARGETVIKPGPLPAPAVPPNMPRAALEPDGSYAGGLVFCSLADARDGLKQLSAKGALPQGRPWRVYEVAADWRLDVDEPRPGEFRLKRAVKMVRAVN